MLLKKAVASYSPVDTFSHGLTVSLLQDAAEMLIWEMAKYFNVQVKPKDGFVSIIENIDKNHGGIDLKPQIFELNSARVNFKHYGNIPSNVDIPKYIETCKQFLKCNALKIGIDFESISSVDTVLIPEIKSHLKNSEDHLESENFKEALIESSIAFQELEKIAHTKIGIDRYALDELRDSYEAWPQDCWESARNFTSQLTNVLEQTIDYLSRGQFGYSPEYVSSVRSMCYHVNISITGNILGVSNMGHAKDDAKSIRYINDFIIEASRRL